jgi:uncharacterized protein YgfB (UPF0149 family)
MNEHYDNGSKAEREQAHSLSQWQARWLATLGTADPSYDRTTAALKRWVDGMEAALSTRKR